MASDNHMENDKRTHGARVEAPHAGQPDSGRAYPEPTYTAGRSSSPYSPYGTAADSPDTHIGGTQPIPIKKGLFDGISVAQVIAASAAAATSMLLASRIGIAGSVIGAAVSSMVTVICSQLYRNALDASARKLKVKQLSHAYEQDALRGYAESEGTSTAVEGSVGANGDGSAPRIRIAPTKLQARAAAERSASKRKVAVVSALIAIAAVAASAGIIMLTTSGQGLGTKAPSVFANRPAAGEPAPEEDVVVDKPVEVPVPQPKPDSNAGAVDKPVEGDGAPGGAGSGSGGAGGDTTSGAPNQDDAPQQGGGNGGSSDTAAGQPDSAGGGVGDTASTPTNKKPAASANGATGAANPTALVLLAGGDGVGEDATSSQR